jgi:hypothetical protein
MKKKRDCGKKVKAALPKQINYKLQTDTGDN